MEDNKKTKDQLLVELANLRQRVAELEAAQTAQQRIQDAIRRSEEKYIASMEIILTERHRWAKQM